MDFKKMKEEALKLKNKALEKSKDAVEYSAWKLAGSKFTLKTIDELREFIRKSKNTEGTNSETWKKKVFSHKVIVIFAETKSEFFKQMLYSLPILQTKAFTQSISIKLADISMKDIKLDEYNITEKTALVVFENMKYDTTLQWEENIQKVVKSFNLDINKTIEEL